MASDRVQRRIERLLDQIDQAEAESRWGEVSTLARDVLDADPENAEALAYLRAAERRSTAPTADHPKEDAREVSESPQPSSFASGRYTVESFLGEGGKKRVYLAHDNTLDRDVAFALIKTEGLDDVGRERVRREAQAMGRMGTHPAIMSIYDLGDEAGQPYMVQPLMAGGDVEGLIEAAHGPLALDRAIEIAQEVCRGLSFAHSKGIVHRDLKPGNVWLDDDGSVKIGDFGLAIATDRSRLTVEKVMVGTVHYMPPEQAVGGELTPRADLYSLGAMLYEMCTGRVPFMGDDDIAVISQHVNTPPVSPSWHNAKVPRSLDSLIMRLLAKDPAERPASADEVLDALGAVDLSAVEKPDDEKKGSLDSMAGGVFVGRQREMDTLKATFEEVLSGKGRMVTLVGEPGIGKTRTAQELATYAGMRGAVVLWGRSYESGGAPPYWPWVQAIRSHVAATDPQTLQSQLGSAGPVVAEVVPDIRERLPDLPAPAKIDDPESARFRLFDSLSTFLVNISRRQPLVLMLEDLHWADRPSLMLLEFFVRELASSKVLVIGNYRDVELNRRHPLSVTLGDLTRERLFERVFLRGLQRHDVQRFIEIAAGITPPAALVDTVYTQTEGNPLFVTETVRLLIQEGDIAAGREARGGTTSWEIRIPEGVREVIGRRLDRLSERCNEVLTIAAVIGRQFRFDVLKRLVEDTTESQLLDAMDEALAARIIEELPTEVGLYQFTHASMQETLIQELSHTRAVRMHARIAEALEADYGDEAAGRAAELARHFAEAETVLGVDRLVRYSLLAGEQAAAAYAHEDARSHFQRALDAIRDKPLDETQAAAFAGRGKARAALVDISGSLEDLQAAFDYFVSTGDRDRAAEVAQTRMITGEGQSGMRPMLERALELVAPESPDAARVMTYLGRVISREGDPTRARALIEKSIEIARTTGDVGLEFKALGDAAFVDNFDLQIDSLARTLRVALELAPLTDDPLTESQFHMFAGYLAGSRGEVPAARDHLDAALRAAEKAGDRDRLSTVVGIDAYLSASRGEWEAARRLFDRSHDYSPTYSVPILGRAMAEYQTGNTDVGREFVNRYRTGYDRSATSDALLLFEVAEITGSPGDVQMATEAYAGIDRGRRRSRFGGMSLLFADALNVLRVRDRDSAKGLLANLAEFDGVYFHSFSSFGTSGATKALAARLAALAGLGEQASALFQRAAEDCERAGFRPALAWNSFFWSQALVEVLDEGAARELEDQAVIIARELGMKPLLDRLLARRKIMKA